MMRSDIFSEYAKIAEDMGLISAAKDEETYDNSAPKESAKLKKYKKSPYPRMGSDDISTIEALYGTKPETIPHYEFNIMEAAHPKPVVIAPAYDRINALVENNIERNNIMCNIAIKPNNSISDNTKLAKKELLMELVRLANDLDLANKDELRKLADSSIQALSNEKKKFRANAGVLDWLKEEGGDVWETLRGASTGGLVGAIIGAFLGQPLIGLELGGAAGGLIAAIARTTPQVRNVAYNANDTKSQIDDIKPKIPAGQLHTFLDNFTNELSNLASIATKYNELTSTLKETHETASEYEVQDAHSITNLLIASMGKVLQYSAQFNANAKNKVYDEFVGHSKALTPLYRFISDDVDDVVDSIKSLTTAINNLKSSMKDIGGDAKPAIEQANTNIPSQQKNQEQISGNNGKEEIVDDEGMPIKSAPNDKKESDEGFFDRFTSGLGIKPSKREEEWFRSLKE